MPMNPQDAIDAAKAELANDINFSNAPNTDKLIAAVVKATLAEVQKATVNVPALGLTAPQGPVTGQAQGTIS